MVTANVERSAKNVQSALESSDIRSIAVIGIAAAGGVIVAQEVADLVLPALQRPMNPSAAVDFGISASVKTVFGVALGFLAAQMGSGIALVALAFHAVGALGSAGADVIEAVQRLLADAGSNGSSSNSAPRQAATAQSGSGNRRARARSTSTRVRA